MQRRLSPDDAAFQQRMRTYFTTEFPADLRERWSAGGEPDPEVIRAAQRRLHEDGLAVPHWPAEYGGQDWTMLQRHIYLQEMQAASVPPPLAFNANMVGPVIAAFGSQEQKDRFLPPTASLDIWWCQGFSEPDAGSDLASLRTTAVKDGDEWVVNGQKTWTTLGQHADWIFALVRTDPDAPKKQMGISFLLIEMSSPGVTVRPIQLIDGGHEVNEVFFDNVRVPADQLVGEENKGWDYAKFLLGNERVGVAPVGSIKRRLAEAKEWAGTVSTDDGTLLDDPLLAARIAELECQVLALELTVLRVAANSREGKPDPASSILKLRGSQLQQDVLELVVDIAGPAGLRWDDTSWEGLAAPTYLNFRKASIYGGSNEVQRQVISSGILGLRG
ncbi:acyl-CoA dehydrogenase family protein [Luteipulveratus sp. YIM 133132]|uniref:Acyl-CoA dehydrogenase family protein n=1 Tax=Luteipulveratus flavus TaxID=3031728 RepID=A0ABT6C5V3_9MICO|nr:MULTISPECIES: acyl-CoA dehydrogenase family protein [unclassified Luteipulveratus]MDE9364100.1 acyl-CoA dehydrogenase family protein [Luteipulveratus sp. YIM 133132]MDF8264318.1 acyl-CoA dehydrogenase family protein [Luteipulveratus sp. YIM 133296]